MQRTLITDLKSGEKVLIKGWIYEIRLLSKMAFILLRDSSGIVQCVVKDRKLMDNLSGLTLESVAEIKGQVKKADIKAEFARKDIEIEVSDFEIISKAETLPIHVNEKTTTTELSTRLDWRSLSLRTAKSNAVFKIQAKILEGIQEWLNKNGFQQIFTPCIIGIPAESGSEVFEVNYFGKKVFLRQDPQLHRQLTIAGGIERLYEIGPSWRAEKSHTTKHLCEHRTCAVELAFINDERDVMRVEEQVIIFAFKKVNEDCKKELEELGIKLKIPKVPFPEINFPEVYSILKKMGGKIKIGEELDSEAEKLLWGYIQKKYPGTEFYFLNKFPFKQKPFYVRKEDNSEYARSTDLYYKGIEMSSGGQRENRHDNIMENLKAKHINPKSVEWFTKFFKYGIPTHGGFGLGIERITMVLLELENIREAVLFPRDTERVVP